MPIDRSRLITVAAVTGAALGAAGLASAATHTTAKSSSTGAGTIAPEHRGNPNETALTGDTLKSASDAALAANAGAKVVAATTEDPAENTGAAYEVHITQGDGSRATVLEDKDFKVLSTKADEGRGPDGRHGHGANPNEKPLTGDDLTKAKAAATAAVSGATVDAATTEDPAENTGAAYEVHARKGTSFITILLDKDFKVVKTETDAGHHH
jgi:uncharacterized membrane protein YkoI